MTFNPKDHLTDLQGKDYLPVAWRLVWFRELFPNGIISTEPMDINDERAIFRCTVTAVDADGVHRGSATGTKLCTARSFARGYVEKAETGSIGRALAALGFGTQFEPELDEGDDIVDTPQSRPQAAQRSPQQSKPATQGNTRNGQQNAAQDQQTTDDLKTRLNRELHAMAPHDLLHDIAVVWGYMSFADMPIVKMRDLRLLLEGHAAPERQQKFNAWREERDQAKAAQSDNATTQSGLHIPIDETQEAEYRRKAAYTQT
jgi:hypothetical protein